MRLETDKKNKNNKNKLHFEALLRAITSIDNSAI